MNRITTRRVAPILTALCMSLAVGALPLQLACGGKDQDKTSTAAPTISSFLASSDGKFNVKDTTMTGTSIDALSGATVYLKAAFATTGGSAVVMPGNIVLKPNTATPVVVTGTTTYTLTVTNASGATTTALVTVNAKSAPVIQSYSNEDATYYVGVKIADNTVTVTGSTPITYSASLPGGLSIDAATGTISGAPTVVSARTAYSITGKNSVGTSPAKSIYITVEDPQVSFQAASSVIAPGSSTSLSWDASVISGLFSSVTITASPEDPSLTAWLAANPGALPLKGSINAIAPTTATTYTLQATSATGGTLTRSATVTVGATAFAIVSFDTDSQSHVTPFGGSLTLTWASTGLPTELTLDGASVLGASSQVVSPVRRQTYTLSGKNSLNSTPASMSCTLAARGLDSFAGSAAAGGFADGKGTAAKFLFATSTAYNTSVTGSMTLGGDGNLYVADTANHVVRMVTPAGVVTTLAGAPGVAYNATTDGDGSGIGNAAHFSSPAQVLYMDANTLYVSDYGTHTLRRMDKQTDGTWQVSLAAGTPGTYGAANTQNLDNPLSIAAYNGKIYIADMYTSTIRVYDPAAAAGSRLSTLAGGSTTFKKYGYADGTGAAALFKDLSGLAIDPSNGDIYVADRENHAIRKVTQAGVVTTVAGAAGTAASGTTDGTGTAARFNRPCAITRDASGNFFISDYGNHAIRKMSPSFEVTTIAGQAGTYGFAEGTGAASLFNGPQGIAVDAQGTVYVADSLNFHLRALTPSGTPATYATSPFAGVRAAGLKQGDAASALFDTPNGVVVSKSGTIYVADEKNQVVRKIGTDGQVSNWGANVTLTAPWAITVDDNENVYVTDRTSSALALVKIDASGNAAALTLTGASPALAKANGQGIAVTKDGSALFVANGTTIQKFDLSTGAQTAALTGVTGAAGFAVASDAIYWADKGTHTIKKADLALTTASVVAGVSGTSGFKDDTTSASQFNGPVAVALALDVDGKATKVYVVDQTNYALRRVDLAAGTVDTLIGGPTKRGAVAGTLETSGTASLYWPKGIGINPTTGDLYVSTSDGIMQVTAP